MKFDDVTRQSLLYDFYGELLTQRQKEVIELYNEENLSLAEIAEEFGISRQGVHDALHKAQKAWRSMSASSAWSSGSAPRGKRLITSARRSMAPSVWRRQKTTWRASSGTSAAKSNSWKSKEK